MKKLLIFLILIMLFLSVGCGGHQKKVEEFSDYIHENAVVIGAAMPSSVTFQCSHGTFTTQDSYTFDHFKNSIGAAVDVGYQDLYLATYEIKMGEEIFVGRKLICHHILRSLVLK